MKRIVVLDTWVNDTNLGNQIIMEAVVEQLRRLFPHDFFYHVSPLEYVTAGRRLIEAADYVILGGTNLLCAHMRRDSEWRLRFSDGLWMKRVILMGVGWWQYQEERLDLWSRILLRQVLHQNAMHSVRDHYTRSRVAALGFEVVNTGCPSLWNLSKHHCDQVKRTRSESALLTLTDYRRNPRNDHLLVTLLKRNYSRVYFWPQAYSDPEYAVALGGSGLVILDPSLRALDDCLRGEEVDCVGTRLHAGIRALQHKRRTIIVAVDNRAVEMGNDFGLPILLRENIEDNLQAKINSSWATEVLVDEEGVSKWKRQFQCEAISALDHTGRAAWLRLGGTAAPRQSGLRAAIRKRVPRPLRRIVRLPWEFVRVLALWTRGAWQDYRSTTTKKYPELPLNAAAGRSQTTKAHLAR